MSLGIPHQILYFANVFESELGCPQKECFCGQPKSEEYLSEVTTGQLKIDI